MEPISIEALDQEIKQARELVDLAESVERLQKNSDFKKIIMKGFFEKEAIRLVHALSSSETQDPNVQANIVNDMRAIGSLHQYLLKILRDGEHSRHNIEMAEEMRVEMLAEGQE